MKHKIMACEIEGELSDLATLAMGRTKRLELMSEVGGQRTGGCWIVVLRD